MARNVSVQVLRGVFANMPSLNSGEAYFATDTGEWFVGPTPTRIGSPLAKFDASLVSSASSGTLYTPPTTRSGLYKVNIYLRITTKSTTSSTLGPVTLSYVDPIGGMAVASTSLVCLLGNETGLPVHSDTANTATTVMQGTATINAVGGQPITYTVGYASVGATAMQYEIHLTIALA